MLCLAASPDARAASVLSIRGGGSGHGIGMSQYGAYGYALHGFSYQAILAHYYTGTTLGQTSPARVVRVLLNDGTAAGFTGATTVAGATTGAPTGSAVGALPVAPGPGVNLQAASTYSVVATPDGRLQLQGPSGKPLGAPVPAPLTVTGPAALAVPGLGSFRGALQFRADGHGGVQTINAVGLDDYVRGVVAAEMPSSWPAQALQAQAVAARTYAITTSVPATGYDVYSDTRSQMYGGVTAETAATDAAVAATSGQTVTSGGRPVVTYFFASSGGSTESIENVWSGSTPATWLVGVPDPYDGAGGDPYHRWGQQISLGSAAAKLGSLVCGRLIGIAVTRHGVSPRILTATVVGTRGRTAVSGQTLQGIFGLPTTYAAFTTVSATGRRGALQGTVFPASSAGSVSIQLLAPNGAWQRAIRLALNAGSTAARATSGASFSAIRLAPGRYRVLAGGAPGPTVTVS